MSQSRLTRRKDMETNDEYSQAKWEIIAKIRPRNPNKFHSKLTIFKRKENTSEFATRLNFDTPVIEETFEQRSVHLAALTRLFESSLEFKGYFNQLCPPVERTFITFLSYSHWPPQWTVKFIAARKLYY